MTAKKKTLTVPLMDQAECGNQELNGICVSGRSQELLLEIRALLDVFAPVGDDYLHTLWIEVPRGNPSDWASFAEMKRWDEDIRTREDYLNVWKANYPRESQWYHVSVSRYSGHTYLHIVENDHWWCRVHDDDGKEAQGKDMEWFLEPLTAYLRELVPHIAADVDAWNRYVDEHLPKRQRTGRIARKDLDRIVPWQRHRPRKLKQVIRMLKECLANEAVYRQEVPETPLPACYREPLPTMSIRVYAKYFRAAYMAYMENCHRLDHRSRRERKACKERLEKAAGMTDVEFYRQYQLGRHGEITDETDFDSVEAFKAMAFDHYGELGLSRMDVHATDHYTPGKWLITFGVSYSAWVDVGCEIALALYEAGAPLLVHNAGKILEILEAGDYVKLTSHTYHDYLNHHNEGSVFSLPYECYVGGPEELTREQYDEIVALAQWKPEEPVVLDETVPLEDPVYDLIREEVSEPLTACGILAMLEEKYGIGIGITEYDDHQHVYLYGRTVGLDEIQFKDGHFSSANEAMLAVMRRFVVSHNESGNE